MSTEWKPGTRKDLLWIFIVAFILRIFLWTNNLSVPIKYYVDPDAYDYVIAAHNLLEENGFSSDTAPPYTPDIFRTPIYPLFIAGVYAISGHSDAAVVLVQLIIGSFLGSLLYLSLLSWGFSRRSGLIAGFLFAADPLTTLNANLLMTETLFTFLIVFGFGALFGFGHFQKRRWFMLAVFLFACAGLARPIGQFLPLVLFPIFIVAVKKGERGRAIFQWMLFALLSSVLIYSWAYRNYYYSGSFTLSSVSDYNLAYYRANAVLESAENLSEEEAHKRVEQMVILRAGAGLSPADSAKVEKAVALEIFKEYPVDTFKVHIKGVVRFLINPGLDTICAQINRENNTAGCALNENQDSGFIGALLAKFSAMNSLQIVIALWSILLLLLLYLGSLWGAYRLFRQRQWLQLLSLLLMILYFVILSAGGETTSRFRIPVVPFLALFAGIGFDSLLSFSRKKVITLQEREE